tara:strand:- start:11480 stop:13786 length:2307 start_codon:yes stop_codon:yes gene_type:complete
MPLTLARAHRSRLIAGLIAITGALGLVPESYGQAPQAPETVQAPGLMTQPPPVTEPNRWTRCNPAPAPCSHPRIALVLSGGGALGLAHVGAIHTLERAGVQPDMIIGTSMGAVVGGLYASGYSADELENVVMDLNWPLIFSGQSPGRSLSYRRRREEESFPAELGFSLDRNGLRLPRGVINDQNLNLALRNLVLVPGGISFDDLPVPFRAIATDIETGDPVSLRQGDLATAMRASMAVPGALSPQEIDGRLLVDGGLSKNIPVDVAQAMGADIIIVVAVQGRLMRSDELRTGVELLAQSMTLLVRSNETAQLDLLGPQDLVIRVDQGDLTSADFNRGEDLIAAGAAAADEVFERLQALATHHTHLLPPPLPVISELVMENTSRLDDAVLEARISQPLGSPLNVEALANDLAEIYGLGAFDSVAYTLRRVDTGTALVVNALAKPDDVAYLRAGLTLENDFTGSSDYRVSLEYRSPPIDRFGSELRLNAVLGDQFGASAELFKLFATDQHVFVAPAVGVTVRTVPRYLDDGFQIASYRARFADARIEAGWQFDNAAEIRVGYRRGTGEARLRQGLASRDVIPIDIGELTASAGLDTLDSAFFPTSGVRIAGIWTLGRDSLGASTDFETLGGDATAAWSRGDDTLILQLEGASRISGELALESLYRIGGLFSLSGYRDGELTGESYALGSLIYRRRLNSIDASAFGIPIYAGASLEAGNIWSDSHYASLSDFTLAGSVFLSADSVMGPIYLSYGLADTSRQSVYFFVGRPF